MTTLQLTKLEQLEKLVGAYAKEQNAEHRMHYDEITDKLTIELGSIEQTDEYLAKTTTAVWGPEDWAEDPTPEDMLAFLADAWEHA